MARSANPRKSASGRFPPIDPTWLGVLGGAWCSAAFAADNRPLWWPWQRRAAVVAGPGGHESVSAAVFKLGPAVSRSSSRSASRSTAASTAGESGAPTSNCSPSIR